jgi:mannose-6-phosphate isomerase-like protein (cupin superfamily)
MVGVEAVAADPALAPWGRGARKHVVTSIFKKKERGAIKAVWRPPTDGQKCPVLVADNWEMATFSEVATQDCHLHRQGTEIYIVLEGTMKVEVDNKIFALNEGDTLVVNPGTVHEVLREGSFLARVITVNCGGPGDKLVV